ncbi:MAG: chorismate mutase, partial [Anaerolineales bacterium]
MAEKKSRIFELRQEIDDINLQILSLLNRRATIASEIGQVQQQLGTRFYDPEREAEMLQALEHANQGPFSNDTIKALFKEIFRATLSLEEREARAQILVQRKHPDERTVIELPEGVTIGDGSLTIVTGPCA